MGCYDPVTNNLFCDANVLTAKERSWQPAQDGVFLSLFSAGCWEIIGSLNQNTEPWPKTHPQKIQTDLLKWNHDKDKKIQSLKGEIYKEELIPRRPVFRTSRGLYLLTMGRRQEILNRPRSVWTFPAKWRRTLFRRGPTSKMPPTQMAQGEIPYLSLNSLLEK